MIDYLHPWSDREIRLYEERIEQIERRFLVLEASGGYHIRRPHRSIHDLIENNNRASRFRIGMLNAHLAAMKNRVDPPWNRRRASVLLR